LSTRGHSAIDAIVRTSYELAAIRCKERNNLCDFLSFADAAQRNILANSAHPGVEITPGDTTFTRMPLGASSIASVRE
jgi:hypothetical protein